MNTVPLTTPSLAMLSDEQCELIHAASLEILRRTGVRVYHAEALDLLRASDAVVTDETLVHLPPGLVEWALDQAPSRIALCQRGSGEVAADLHGTHVSLGTGSDCPYYLDPRTGERRRFTTADLIDCIHLVDAIPELSFCMSMGIPVDSGGISPYRRQFALMIEHTEKPIVFVCNDRADCEAIVAMAATVAGGITSLRLNPNLLLYSEPSTPLRQSETATGKLLYMAEQCLPVVHSPAPMMGGTAPVTLAGGLALGNAEVLSGLVIHQLKHPGAPFVYGQGLHHMDMQTSISVYGAPEFQLARVLVAQMGRHYHLPTWGYAGHSDSCVMDAQAAADAAFSVMVALLTGTNLVHDVGYLEAGMTTSPEMVVFTADQINQMRFFMDGVSLDAEHLALDVIEQVGPGGDFLTHDHTLRYFRNQWRPALYSRQRYDDWVATGARSAQDRLRDRTLALIEAHRPPELDGRIKQEIEAILRAG